MRRGSPIAAQRAFVIAPVQTYQTADGRIFIMCMTDKFWSNLANSVGRPDLTTDTRFNTQAQPTAGRSDFRVLDNTIKVNDKRAGLAAAPTLGADNERVLGKMITKERVRV
jgi:crotonobetainyl-CoA:carnitine CoA-transferase CaiB-like acyl-CoA transferase